MLMIKMKTTLRKNKISEVAFSFCCQHCKTQNIVSVDVQKNILYSVYSTFKQFIKLHKDSSEKPQEMKQIICSKCKESIATLVLMYEN